MNNYKNNDNDNDKNKNHIHNNDKSCHYGSNPPDRKEKKNR